MSIKNWIKLVKNAIDTDITSYNAFRNYIDAKNNVCALESRDEMPNNELEKELGVTLCEIKYCPEEIFGSLLEHDPEAIVHKCSCFNEFTKCTNKECRAYSINSAYIDAKNAHDEAARLHKNAVRRVFGISKMR